MKLTEIGQISLTVNDVDTAEDFYKNTLSLQKLFRFDDLIFFDCAGIRLFITKPEQESFSPASSIIYFQTSDIAVAVQELKYRLFKSHTWYLKWKTMIYGWHSSKIPPVIP